ncbi:protein involved in carbohydrate transport [Arthrobacter sp. Hiyo8]|nr:protein involved in carbohydrate transport [Arthrobacter sp. Hiyo8]
MNWGGSTFAVTSQAGDQKLAAEVAKGLYADDASLTDGWKTQTIFPLNQNVLKSDAFTNNAVDFFGGQTANKDIYIPAENAYKGFSYSPFSVYYYAQLQAETVKINAGKVSGDEAATELQGIMVNYAKSQGFTVN